MLLKSGLERQSQPRFHNRQSIEKNRVGATHETKFTKKKVWFKMAAIGTTHLLLTNVFMA